MKKSTEASASDDKADTALKFEQLAKDNLRQDTVHDFVSYTTDGNCISLIGSKSELVTMELTSKLTYHVPFPYILATAKFSNKKRPLDHLVLKVNIQHIYGASNVLEMQQLSLEPTYSAICSEEVPVPKIIAAKLAPEPLPGGQMLLAALNSYGALDLLTKRAEQTTWEHYSGSLNLSVSLRDDLQTPYEMKASKIETFRQFQAYIDRSWITMFAWRPVDGKLGIVLGTAAGSIWTLTLSTDAQTVLSHFQLQTLLDRICYMHIFEDLLLVGDTSGLVHLYRYCNEEEEGLCLVKTLWLRPDHMGLQQALITHCPVRKCNYIACCKAAHLLIWCMPREANGEWLETRLHAGGMKITALCIIENYNYALTTARGDLYRIEVNHKSGQLSASMRLIELKDIENFQPVGLFSSPHNNLLTVLLTRNTEYVLNAPLLRHQLMVRVGRLKNSDVMAQLANCLSPKKAINSCSDLLAEMRLDIINGSKLDEYMSYAPLNMFAFDDIATESQLLQLQLKYHVLDAFMQAQQVQLNELPLEQSKREMQLLLAMLAMTHIRLRLQYLSSLNKLNKFQQQATQSMLAESARIRQQLNEQKDHPHMASIQQFLVQMEQHFEALQLKFNVPQIILEDTAQLCNVSLVQLKPSLERRYCSLCGRQALLEKHLLMDLYAKESPLLCPCCRGEYNMELLDA